MTSRRVTAIAVAAAIAALVSILPPIIQRLSPPTGLVRSVFSQLAFGGVPTDGQTNEINLRFLDEQPSLPRQNFSARWRGYFFVARAQTLKASGRLRDALRELDRVPIGDSQRAEADRLRAEIQRHLLAAAAADPRPTNEVP